MNQIWFSLVSIAFLVVAGFFVYVLIELGKSVKAMTEFLKSTNDELKPTLEELRETMKSLKQVTDDINGITEDIRLVSGSTREIGRSIKKVSSLLEEVSSEAIIRYSGWRVGIKTALEVLIKNLMIKKGDDQ